MLKYLQTNLIVLWKEKCFRQTTVNKAWQVGEKHSMSFPRKFSEAQFKAPPAQYQQGFKDRFQPEPGTRPDLTCMLFWGLLELASIQ